MITLCGRDAIDTKLYDKVWYATHTCPGMGPGCEHHPELAASQETCNLCYGESPDNDEFYRRFVQELQSEPWQTHLRNLVELSNKGEWIQLIYYELDPNEGERKYVYDALRKMTSDVNIM